MAENQADNGLDNIESPELLDVPPENDFAT